MNEPINISDMLIRLKGMRKIDVIRERNKLRTNLRAEEKSEEEIDEVLKARGYNSILGPASPKEDVKPKEILNEDEVKSYCFRCRARRKVIGVKITKKEVKPKSFRSFASGICNNCGGKISYLVKNRLNPVENKAID